MGRDTAYWYRRGRGCLWAKAGYRLGTAVRNVDVRPNWKEQPSQQSLVGKVGDNLFTLINAAAYPPM
jgi:hypothetical protein